MDADQYTTELQRAHMLAQILAAMPLREMLDLQSRAEAIAPIVDPTLYSEKADAMHEDREVLSALRAAQLRLEKAGRCTNALGTDRARGT
jgi:hypothetical protein